MPAMKICSRSLLSSSLLTFICSALVLLSANGANAATLYYELNVSKAKLTLDVAGANNGFVEERRFVKKDSAYFWVNLDTWDLGFSIYNSSRGEITSNWSGAPNPELDPYFGAPVEINLTVFGYDDYWYENVSLYGQNNDHYKDLHDSNLPLDYGTLASDPKDLLKDGVWNDSSWWANNFTETAGVVGSHRYPTLGEDFGYDLVFYGSYLLSKQNIFISNAAADSTLSAIYFDLSGVSNPKFVKNKIPGSVANPEPASLLLMLPALFLVRKAKRDRHH
jgi:hypothetical protein